MYIIKKQILNTNCNNNLYLKLNRYKSVLEIYKRADKSELWSNYPIRKDFDASNYVMYERAMSFPCIYGGEGDTRTPAGLFNIEKVSNEEYISPYHPKYDQVKFFGYIVVFEDYFIHSDMYPADIDISTYEEAEPISLYDKYTSGCIRVSQEDLRWLLGNIPAGTTIEL